MDLDDDGENDVEHKQILVARLNLRDLTYRLRSAGITAGERLTLQEMEGMLLLLASFMFYKYQEAQEFDFCDHIWNFLNGIEPEDDIRSNVCLLFFEFLKWLEMIMPVTLTLEVRPAQYRTILSLDDSFCWAALRWRKRDLLELFHYSLLPAEARLPDRQKVNGETVMLLGMYAWAWPQRQLLIAREFGLAGGQPVVSKIMDYYASHFLEHFQHLIQSESMGALSMWTPMVSYMVECVQQKGIAGPDFSNVGMFIDGTFNHCCRPEQREDHLIAGRDTQRAVYSGYYAGWGLKYLHCVLPNGILAQVWGPVDGRRHDAHLFAISHINEKLESLSQQSGTIIHAHGDSAFPASSHTVKGGGWEMNRKRICVEWSIGKILSQGASLDMSVHQQIYLNRPGALYIVGCLMTNFHTCVYGSETGLYFACKAPTLESYMRM
jgi:nuclease HARBI1